MSRFAGKVAIITGSSNGIGRATAILLGQHGAKVTITGRNGERLEKTAESLKNLGADVNVVIGDITDTECQDALISSTLERFGRIDILVNNAGAAFTDADPSKIGIDSGIDVFKKTLDVNIISVVQLIQKCKPHLISAKGEIVNVSTIASEQTAFIHYTYYGMAKAAMDQMTRCTALELIKDGVRVNSVSPGLVDTGFLTAFGFEQSTAQKVNDYYKTNRDCIPAGVVGKSEDIAKCIAFLADRDSSSYIVGQNIVIDGGTSLVNAMSTHDLSKILA